MYLSLKATGKIYGNGSAQIPTHQKKPRFKFKKVVKNVMKEVLLQDIATKLEPVFRRVVKQELEKLICSLQPSPRYSLQLPHESSGSRGYQLRFVNQLPSTIFTNSRIESEENSPVKIELLDANSKNLVRHGPLSSLEIEILVLRGNFPAEGHQGWNQKEFNDNIVREREGKRPLLVGDTSFSLINGVAVIGNTIFTDNSSWVRSRKFRLGVRVLPGVYDGLCVIEAVSEAFVVLDHRGESYQKHDKPSLYDPVWRLKKIAKGGAFNKRLNNAGIHIVKQFLQLYHVNPSSLRRILGSGVSTKTWQTMIDHANACRLDDTAYMLADAPSGIRLLLNCVYKIIKVTFDGTSYLSVDTLNMQQLGLVDKLMQNACKNVNKLVPVSSLSALFPSMSMSMENAILLTERTVDLQCFDTALTDEEDRIYADDLDRQLDFYQSETSVSNPCTLDESSSLWDISTDQAIQGSYPAAISSLVMGDSSSQLPGGGHPWDAAANLMPTACPHSPLFWDGNFPCQPSTQLPIMWGQGNGMFASSSCNGHLGVFTPLPNLDVNVSRSKVAWCKIRALVVLKIVRRDAAARRKGKIPFLDL